MRKKRVSPTKSDNSIPRVRNEPERQIGSLRDVIGNIRRDGGKPSVESIATQLSGMHTAQRAPALLALQQTHGNRYVQRVFSGIQAKLKVGQPGDVYEQEADRVADEVMRMPEPQVQRQVVPEEEEEENRPKVIAGAAPEVTLEMGRDIQSVKGAGQPLSTSERAFFEPRFEANFGNVYVHSDTRAANVARPINARAFTLGRDVVFGAGQYSPGNSSGRKLLAHELTHVVQKNGGPDLRLKKVLTPFPDALKGSGQPLPESVRTFFEPRSGYDFSGVRLHTDSRAAETAKAVKAWAFTVGQDIVFAAGQYSPETTKGQELLGHELTHVLQQRQGRVKPMAHVRGMPVNYDKGLESEADLIGKKVSQAKLSNTALNHIQNSKTELSHPTSIQKKDEIVQFALPAIIAGLTATEWIALGALGYVMGQSAVGVPSGDVNYTFDEMEGTLLPGGGSDVPAYRAAHPTAQTYRATHHFAVWFGYEDSRRMGIKMGITFLYDDHAIGSISIGILDTYDWPTWGGNVIVNLTPEALASGDRAQVRITVNMSTVKFLGMNEVSSSGIFLLRADGDLSDISSGDRPFYEIG